MEDVLKNLDPKNDKQFAIVAVVALPVTAAIKGIVELLK